MQQQELLIRGGGHRVSTRSTFIAAALVVSIVMNWAEPMHKQVPALDPSS
jgi:hypothetical protein